MSEQNFKDEIYSAVNALLDANHKRMIDWEQNAVQNIQKNVMETLKATMPPKQTLLQHYFGIVLNGLVLGSTIGLMVHLLK